MRANAEEDEEWCHAACNLACALADQGKHADAEGMFREVLAAGRGAH